jgi:hypothetical protein
MVIFTSASPFLINNITLSTVYKLIGDKVADEKEARRTTSKERIRQLIFFSFSSRGSEEFLRCRMYDLCRKVARGLSPSDSRDFCKVIRQEEICSGFSGTDS